VITGGASGIGLATAKRFAESGVYLVLGDIEEATLKGVGQGPQGGRAKVIGVPTDVTKEDDVIALRDAALKEFGAAHVVFNNAGVAAGATIGTPTKVWKWVLDVDLNGVIYGLNAFVPRFMEQNEGHVVNTAYRWPVSAALRAWDPTARPSSPSWGFRSRSFKSCCSWARTSGCRYSVRDSSRPEFMSRIATCLANSSATTKTRPRR